MLNLANLLAHFQEIAEREDVLEDDTADFETFVCLQYENDSVVAKRTLNFGKTELDTPLKLYKYLLLKVFLPINSVSEFGNRKVCKLMQEQFDKTKSKYMDFVSKEVPMTAEESKYVKSAFAALQLSDISLKIQLKEFKVEEFNFLELKDLCFDIINSYNAAGEATVQYLFAIAAELINKRYFQTAQILVSVMTKIMEMTREVRTRVGLVPENTDMDKNLKQIEQNNENVKMICLHHLFTNASLLKLTGEDQSTRIPKEDGKKAKILLKLFENSDGDDEFYKNPVQIISSEQAKVIYEKIQKVADGQEARSGQYVQEAEHYKALAVGNLAVFETDRDEAYRLCEKSLRMLEDIRKQDNEHSKSKDAVEMIDISLSRMWRIKFEIYNEDKSQENLTALREIAYKRIKWGKFMISISDKTDFAIKGWRINLDMAACVLLVYSDYSCFKKFAGKIYVDLNVSSFDISNFEKAAGISFERSMSKKAFFKALADKINPNIVKIKNPFEDGTNFESFVAFSYDEPSKDILVKTNLNTPLNIYKYVLVMLAAPAKTDEKFSTAEAKEEMLKKMVSIKQKYKDFLTQEISMTAEERKYVRTAYETVKLAQITLNVDGNRENFKVEEFNFHTFKEICKILLDGFVGEVSVIYLLPVFYQLMHKLYFEAARFVLCVMTEILQKSEKVRAENKSSLEYCACVLEIFTGINTKLNFLKWNFLDRALSISSILHTIGPMSIYQKPGSDKSKGKMLMELFDNYQGDDIDFHKISLRAENYEQAKQLYDVILKLAKERETLQNIITCDDTKLFEALAKSSLADFHTNPDEVYNLSESSTKLLLKSLEGDDKEHCDHEMGHVMAAIDSNYRRIWKIKLDIYKREKSSETRTALKEIASRRIKWGNILSEFEFNLPFEDWWINLDMLKCYLQVFGDPDSAKHCAETIWNDLISDPDEIKVFVRCAGVKFDRFMNKQKFIKKLILKYK